MKAYSEVELRDCLHHHADLAPALPPLPERAHGQVAGSERSRRATLVPLAVAASVALIAAVAVFASTMMDRGDDKDPTAPNTTMASTNPPPTATADTDGPPSDGLTLDEVFVVTGYQQRPADDGDDPAVTSDAALSAVGATEVLGLVWVGTERVDPDAGVTASPTISWRLSWVVSGEPREAGSVPPPIGTSASPDPTLVVQDVAFVDADSGEVYAQFIL